jgi:plasmid stabilization system protein ParE
VEELGDPAIREIVYGNYRIIYLFDGEKLEIITVRHAARLLRGKDLEGE